MLLQPSLASRRAAGATRWVSSGSPESSSAASARGRNAIGPFTIRSGAVFLLTGAGLYYYFQQEKAKLQQRKSAETANQKVGRPKIGGPFELTDQDGKTFSDKDLLGKWSLVYFGFTNCPDICPEELDKMSVVVKDIGTSRLVVLNTHEAGGFIIVSTAKSHETDILPVFITCDPARDDVKAVKAYIRDFHPSLVGLTGSYDDIKKTCKAYRVYFSTPPNAKPTDDYLVDHSIFFYLMDPNGKFVDAFGRSMGPDEVKTKIGKYLDEFRSKDGKPFWYEQQQQQ
ncbi:Cu-binding protein [Microbotryomycetes sp. JL201]|nr:Cu-binding protein [Microbotryomycetes sp. JL201]